MPDEKMTQKQKVDAILHVSDNLVKIYAIAAGVLETSIEQTKSSPVVGFQALEMFGDLLHGGAYKHPINQLPYYRPDVQQSRKPGAIGIENVFTLPNGEVIALPNLAKPEQLEALLNANEPHVFLKLLSDQEYYLMKERVSLAFSADLITNGFTTPLTTLVVGSTGGGESGLGASGLGALAALIRSIPKG